MVVFPGVIPQKQGMVQVIGSFRRDWIVSRAFAGSKVSSGVGVSVPVTVGWGVIVSVRVGVNVKVGTAVVAAKDRVGDGRRVTCVRGSLAAGGEHPAKPESSSQHRNKKRGFSYLLNRMGHRQPLRMIV